MKDERKILKYNNKDFIFISKINDPKYGEITKAISTKIKDFERIYLREKDGKYILIKDQEILDYLYENYEKIISDVIF